MIDKVSLVDADSTSVGLSIEPVRDEIIGFLTVLETEAADRGGVIDLDGPKSSVNTAENYD